MNLPRILTGKRGLTLDERLELIKKDLIVIEDIHDLNDHPAWKRIREIFTAYVDGLQEEQNRLARKPRQNEEELLAVGSLREAASKLFGLIDDTIKREPEILEERKRLEVHAELVRTPVP